MHDTNEKCKKIPENIKKLERFHDKELDGISFSSDDLPYVSKNEDFHILQ